MEAKRGTYKYDWRQDPLVPEPEILVAPAPRTEKKPTDVTDFPTQRVLEIPEDFAYPEGKYRPPTLPYRGGYFPWNIYLEQGKNYRWCSCGASWNEPFCDHKCHLQATRNRPILFACNQSGYYKLCSCKQSANAPFCNSTCTILARNFSRSYFGQYRMVAGFSGIVFLAFAYYNFKN